MNPLTKLIEEVINNLRAEPINDSLWYVNPIRLRDALTKSIHLAYEQGRKDAVEEVREIIEENGHQQEDTSIWCNMDILLSKLTEMLGDKK